MSRRAMTLHAHGRLATTISALVVLTTVGCTAAPVAPSAAPTPSNDTSTFASNPARCSATHAEALANPPVFAAGTTWNQPAACLPTNANSAHWANNWFSYANVPGRTDPAKRGMIDIAFDEYSTPVYQYADHTQMIEVFLPEWGWGTNLEDRMLPWNPAWTPAAGNDHEMIIVDPATGREWDLWGVHQDNWTPCLNLGNLALGFDPAYDLCVGMASLGTNPDGTVSDYRKSSGMSSGFGRGFADVLGLALLPTLDEIERGSINHALNMETYNTMFGPACTTAQMGTSAAGTSCGYAVAPATRVEWADGPYDGCGAVSLPNTEAGRSTTVPEGMRFVADLTDAQIEQWLDGRGYTGARRRTARVFAVALRDYGWIISDTSCWGSSVAVEGVANPDAAQRWQALGIDQPAPDGDSLMDGLITSAAQVRALAPSSPAPILTSN